jgi:hypothetical protein
MKTTFSAAALLGAVCGCVAAPSPYVLTWDSPSADSNGTMPLGNGEVALNAWIEPSGDLRFYLARTDAWDDYGRLLKIGGARVKVGQRSLDGFRQTLTVRDGTLTANYGGVKLRLWVDAHRPVVYVEIDSEHPTAPVLSAEVWRTKRFELPNIECSDVLNGAKERMLIEPDMVLGGLRDQIGWYHRNVKSVGPELCGKIQGVGDFPRPDPLLGRTFGALASAAAPERRDDQTLGSREGRSHLFALAVHTRHPATAEQWLADAQRLLADAAALPLAQRRAAHEQWWGGFWQRSWIHLAKNDLPPTSTPGTSFPPANKLPVSLGQNSAGGSRFSGEFGRVGLYDRALDAKQIAALAVGGPQDKAPADPPALFSEVPAGPRRIEALAAQPFAQGCTIEAWIRAETGFAGDGRIVDKISVGGADGFLLDTHPGNSLRLIVGGQQVSHGNVLKPKVWQHVAATLAPSGALAVWLNGQPLGSAAGGSELLLDQDDAFVVMRAYALQRYVNACGGRGRYPIKYNGSILTVPAEGRHSYADYRAWGPGYWWQNTRLPYFSMPTSGDYELMDPLFAMYARDLLPLMVHRTRRHTGHGGAYIPECIYFWGDMFSETYGWQPCDQRADKLQASRWHKWEWVSGLELVSLLLDRFDHTQDEAFLRATVLPAARELLLFFDQHYPLNAEGKLVMHPAQACETWWECTNPMPELAGLWAATERLSALPENLTAAQERAFWRQLRAKLPALPTTTSPAGKPMLAPAEKFAHKSNIECPELYAVFPFRQVTFDRPNAALGIEALQHRRDRGPFGWRQEDLFMTHLGLAAEARDYVVQRARRKHGPSRFPAFWGPNYDWVPDQCHGGVLLRAVQTMLLQTEGRTIWLLPAWPAEWDCEFRLYAPYQTVLEGKVVKGELVDLKVTPEARRGDVRVRVQPEKR